MSSGVANSVHLPSLRGQSQSFHTSKQDPMNPSAKDENSLEAFNDSRFMRESTTKKLRAKKGTHDSKLG